MAAVHCEPAEATTSAVEGHAQRIALDVHAHLVPVAPGRLEGIAGVHWNAERRLLEVDGHMPGVPALYQPEALIAWMDQHRVEHAWISIPPPLYRQALAEDASRQWVEYLNDGLLEICERFPERLSPLFHTPVEHPALAAQIVAGRTAQGHRGFAVAAGGSATPVYSDARLVPFWVALDAAGAFLFIHPGACCDGRLKAFYLDNLVGNPYETAVAASHLIFGGVCERFPRVRFCLAHGGGATAMLAGRLQHGFATGRQGIDTAREAPRNALARFHVDCITHDNRALEFVCDTVGPDRVVFGSDWPFPMGLMEPHERLDSLAGAMRRQLLWDNPLALRAQYGRWDAQQEAGQDRPAA